MDKLIKLVCLNLILAIFSSSITAKVPTKGYAKQLNKGKKPSPNPFKNLTATADQQLSQNTQRVNSTNPIDCKVILIHGTFARASSWYQPGGCFFNTLQAWGETQGINLELSTFKWSGALSALKRMEAATELLKTLLPILQTSQVPVILVGHSHGANVIFLATQLLSLFVKHEVEQIYLQELNKFIELNLTREKEFSQDLEGQAIRSMFEFPVTDEYLEEKPLSEAEANAIKDRIVASLIALNTPTKSSLSSAKSIRPIEAIYALGAPIDATVYWPADDVVNKIYSIYSEGDKIQIYSAQFKRRFSDFTEFKPEHCKVYDLKLTFGSTPKSKGLEHPKHLQLNTEIVGRWLMEIPRLIQEHSTNINLRNRCGQGWIHFYKDFSRPILR